MVSIQIDENTARRLEAAANQVGLSLNDFVRSLVDRLPNGSRSTGQAPDFKTYLQAMPDVGSDSDFARSPDSMRTIDFSE
jgi:hypothetical protein